MRLDNSDWRLIGLAVFFAVEWFIFRESGVVTAAAIGYLFNQYAQLKSRIR